MKEEKQVWPLTEDNVKIIRSMELEVVEDYAEMYEDSFKGKTPKKGKLERVKDGIDELIEVFHS